MKQARNLTKKERRDIYLNWYWESWSYPRFSKEAFLNEWQITAEQLDNIIQAVERASKRKRVKG